MREFISGNDPGDEDDFESSVWFVNTKGLPAGWRPSPWHWGSLPGVPRGTSQPELNIPPFTTKDV